MVDIGIRKTVINKDYREWQKRKKELLRKQEDVSGRRSTHKLIRIYKNASGKEIRSFEGAWPFGEEEAPIIQRICNFMPELTSPKDVKQRLERGEKVTTKYGAVYSLIAI